MTSTESKIMPLHPNFWTTHIGSVPYLEVEHVSDFLVKNIGIPAWSQFPRRTFRENMYVQFSPTLPSIVVDETQEKIYFNTRGDFNSSLEEFYSIFLANDLERFALRPE
jgi:hypothetical protein